MPIIQIVAFRGAGGIKRPTNPFYGEPGLVRAGHVGLQGIIDGKIIGFSPTPDAAKAAGGEQALLEALFIQRTTHPGRLQDDTALFIRAHEIRHQTRHRTTVWELDVEVSDQTIATTQEWYNSGRTALYTLPNNTPPEFASGQYNCATFPARLDIPIPGQTGRITQYVKAMKDRGARQWQPNNRNR